jgi:hypothetical protein
VYRFIIDDVINQVRGEFEDTGIDDAVLQELQRVSQGTVVILLPNNAACLV